MRWANSELTFVISVLKSIRNNQYGYRSKSCVLLCNYLKSINIADKIVLYVIELYLKVRVA